MLGSATMAAQLIDGKTLAKRYRGRVKRDVRKFVEQQGRAPGLDVVLVGEDPASQVYTRAKERAAARAGIRGRLHKLPKDCSEPRLLAFVAELNADPQVDGILVQLPLPPHISADKVVDAIHPAKDVDGFHPLNAGLLSGGRPGLVPCTPLGCMHLLAHTGVDLQGKQALVVGRSNIVGKPMAQLLLAQHATVTIAHSRTADLAEHRAQADVLVVAVGRPEMVKGAWIKPGAVVIDVGINRNAEGKLIGDVETTAAAEKAAWITPVPGGVGPMTIACLLRNTLTAATARAA